MPEQIIIPKQKILVDPVSSLLSYIGWANGGTATSASIWEIAKIEYDAGGNFISLKWADGNGNFNNIWDNRATLTYS